MKKLTALCAIAVFATLSIRTVVSAADHAAVGSEKCAKMCHKVEFQSWSESKHATAKEKTECETCHGNGADYMKMTIMKDPAKAKEMGLTAKPAIASCTAKCHKPADIKPEMLAKVHAHKVKS
jgi:hypothetical protein